jgi:asparagine synthase (glutamine-hydrolysing)
VDSWAHRIRWLRKSDAGNENKGMLARNGIELRDPAADLRVVEFCLSVPVEQYLHRGVPRSLLRRAMADRLPPMILEERRKGLQAADWWEGLTAARNEIAAELQRLAACEAVAGVLDIERLQRAVADWPTDGWERRSQIDLYRSALLRGLSAGHFVRSALAKQPPPRVTG